MKQDEVERHLPFVLNATDWKTSAVIALEIRGRSGELPALAQVFLALEKAEDAGWVESRDKNVQKTLGNPKGTRREFRQKPGARRPIIEGASEEATGDLVPVRA